MDASNLDLEDLPPKALRKLIKSLLAKMGKPASGKDADDADDEREALADLHAEHKGKPPTIPVTDEDLPFNVGDDEEDDDDAKDDDASESSDEEDDDKEEDHPLPAFLKKGKKKGKK